MISGHLHNKFVIILILDDKTGGQREVKYIAQAYKSIGEHGCNPRLPGQQSLLFLTTSLHCLGVWCVMLGKRATVKYANRNALGPYSGGNVVRWNMLMRCMKWSIQHQLWWCFGGQESSYTWAPWLPQIQQGAPWWVCLDSNPDCNLLWSWGDHILSVPQLLSTYLIGYFDDQMR